MTKRKHYNETSLKFLHSIVYYQLDKYQPYSVVDGMARVSVKHKMADQLYVEAYFVSTLLIRYLQIGLD